jgi:hypothetical protein
MTSSWPLQQFALDDVVHVHELVVVGEIALEKIHLWNARVHLTVSTAREGTTGEHMVRINKDGRDLLRGAVHPAELEERQHSEVKAEPAAKAITLERFEAGRYAFIAVAGDVQVGWCIRRDGGWYIDDPDGNSLAGPFQTIAAAASASQQILAHEAGASNPGW